VAWVVDADARTVSRLAGSSRAIDVLSTGATPLDLAVGSGSPWVVNGARRNDVQFTGPVATGVVRLEPATGTERAEVPLRTRTAATSNRSDNHITARGTGVWVVTPYYEVVRIETSTGVITARTHALPAIAIAAGPAGVWALGDDGSVARLDERTARPVARTRIRASSVGSIAVGRGAVWVTSPDEGTLWRINARHPVTVGAIELQRGISDVVVGADGAVWVGNPPVGTLIRIDPRTSKSRIVRLGAIPRSLAMDGETLWVAAVADPVARPSTDGGVRSFPRSTCEPVVPGDRRSDLLVVSDLPLQMGSRAPVSQMSQAIEFVLREHGFRAGRWRVAYQSCDDSLARTSLFDKAKCASNARAYASNPDVVGVVGPYNSDCAVWAVPELNRSAAGPLVMVSPLNSFVGLTRAGPGIDESLPGALYPTGVRNYARVYPTDDLEEAALALFARARGWEDVFVLDDGHEWWGALHAEFFETAARRVGLDVLGRASWDPQSADYSALARRVQASGARAVYLGGLVDTNAAEVVRALRSRLGRDVALLASSGLTPVPLLVERSRGAGVGVYVPVAGVGATERFPTTGKRWAKRFAAAYPSGRVEPEAVYAAQATEVLLAAIARSDGTRASVLRNVFATRMRHGLIGSLVFDANGDVSERPVTIARVDRGGSSRNVLSLDGATIVSVQHPSPNLVPPKE
jgi:branched-chain amino acid transport system substrate-binding protein